MANSVRVARGLEAHGIADPPTVHWNLSMPVLVEHAIRRGEGVIAESGPLVCETTPHTGRSPHDKFIVREPSSADDVWWGSVNRSITPEQFDALHADLARHLGDRELWVRDAYAGADPTFRLPIRVVTETAWHNLFAHHMFIRETDRERLAAHEPEFTVLNAPSFAADPGRHGTNSATAIAIHFEKRLVLIAGTAYAGEIKKSIFTVMNYLLPHRSVLPMHCSANRGDDDDAALFFGLSGTGKTTLSSDVERTLIGDDEHGWSDDGVFNFEGGCYAKLIRLSAEAEPQIYATTQRFGTLLENVVLDPSTRRLDLDDGALTENTRGAYPISYIENHAPSGRGGHPRHVVMLTADAFGVLPPIARLTPAGAMYHFLSGYTAKVAGTEEGVTEPVAVFSTCFGAPFMVWHPAVYAKLLGERIAAHGATVWLVNTGWTAGPYGVGSRMPIAQTRAMIRAALAGALDDAQFVDDPVFRVAVPTRCPGVPDKVLTPRDTWSRPSDYDAHAGKLAAMFRDNFKAFDAAAGPDVAAAGPC
jgi:phosphoenolpyruvate carboxykinase (ATP)